MKKKWPRRRDKMESKSKRAVWQKIMNKLK